MNLDLEDRILAKLRDDADYPMVNDALLAVLDVIGDLDKTDHAHEIREQVLERIALKLGINYEMD
jgi:hypothetical protein